MRAVVHVLALGALNDSNCARLHGAEHSPENLIVHDGKLDGIYATAVITTQIGPVRVSGQPGHRGVESFRNHKAASKSPAPISAAHFCSQHVWVLDSRLHDNGGDE